MGDAGGMGIGNRVAPARFMVFLLLLAGALGLAIPLIGWRLGVMAGFDIAALVFLASVIPLLGHRAETMRALARRNDANRLVLLAISGAVSIVILVAVGAELGQKGRPDAPVIGLIVATLAIAWAFGNMVYALHYAHLYYSQADGRDAGGLNVPGTDTPDYGDFIYFAATLGMTFQTSDVEITAPRVRHVVTVHSLAAFVFNLGVVAFTVNVLGGA